MVRDEHDRHHPDMLALPNEDRGVTLISLLRRVRPGSGNQDTSSLCIGM